MKPVTKRFLLVLMSILVLLAFSSISFAVQQKKVVTKNKIPLKTTKVVAKKVSDRPKDLLIGKWSYKEASESGYIVFGTNGKVKISENGSKVNVKPYKAVEILSVTIDNSEPEIIVFKGKDTIMIGETEFTRNK